MNEKKHTLWGAVFLVGLWGAGYGFPGKALGRAEEPLHSSLPQTSSFQDNPSQGASFQGVSSQGAASQSVPPQASPQSASPQSASPQSVPPASPKNGLSAGLSPEESYAFLQKKFGHHPVRMLFFWTAGIFGLSPRPTPFGGVLEKEFFQKIEEVLHKLPFVTVEIITDKRTLDSSQAYFNTLSSLFNNRFRIFLAEDILRTLKEKDERNLLNKRRTALLLEGLENAVNGNPALASDIVRIEFLHDPQFPLNLYVDVDSFVFNVRQVQGRQKLHLIFPSTPVVNNAIRMDLDNGLRSNDILASYGFKDSFDPVRHRFLEYLEDPERRAILQHYGEKSKAVSFQDPQEGFSFYKDSIRRLLNVLKDDLHRQKDHRKFTISYHGKDRGLLFVIALLKTTGTACDAGASSFEKQIYQGLKPSLQAWGTFAWPSVEDLMAHPDMATFFAYLFDWEILKRSERKDFLRQLAEEILRLHALVKASYGLDKVTAKQDHLTHQVHQKVVQILKSVQDFVQSLAAEPASMNSTMNSTMNSNLHP